MTERNVRGSKNKKKRIQNAKLGKKGRQTMDIKLSERGTVIRDKKKQK